jgi:ABC-type phosphate transport system substrate-binding protein
MNAMRRRVLLALASLCLLAGVESGARAQDVLVVVSSKSAVTSLSPSQVADIFLGKSSRFPDGSQAVPVDQPEDSPARDRFYAQYTGKSAAQVKAHWSKIIFTGRGQPPVQAGSDAEVKKMLAQNPAAIGYIDPASVDDTVRVLPR